MYTIHADGLRLKKNALIYFNGYAIDGVSMEVTSSNGVSNCTVHTIDRGWECGDFKGSYTRLVRKSDDKTENKTRLQSQRARKEIQN